MTIEEEIQETIKELQGLICRIGFAIPMIPVHGSNCDHPYDLINLKRWTRAKQGDSHLCPTCREPIGSIVTDQSTAQAIATLSTSLFQQMNQLARQHKVIPEQANTLTAELLAFPSQLLVDAQITASHSLTCYLTRWIRFFKYGASTLIDFHTLLSEAIGVTDFFESMLHYKSQPAFATISVDLNAMLIQLVIQNGQCRQTIIEKAVEEGKLNILQWFAAQPDTITFLSDFRHDKGGSGCLASLAMLSNNRRVLCWIAEHPVLSELLKEARYIQPNIIAYGLDKGSYLVLFKIISNNSKLKEMITTQWDDADSGKMINILDGAVLNQRLDVIKWLFEKPEYQPLFLNDQYLKRVIDMLGQKEGKAFSYDLLTWMRNQPELCSRLKTPFTDGMLPIHLIVQYRRGVEFIINTVAYVDREHSDHLMQLLLAMDSQGSNIVHGIIATDSQGYDIADSPIGIDWRLRAIHKEGHDIPCGLKSFYEGKAIAADAFFLIGKIANNSSLQTLLTKVNHNGDTVIHILAKKIISRLAGFSIECLNTDVPPNQSDSISQKLFYLLWYFIDSPNQEIQKLFTQKNRDERTPLEILLTISPTSRATVAHQAAFLGHVDILKWINYNTRLQNLLYLTDRGGYNVVHYAALSCLDRVDAIYMWLAQNIPFLTAVSLNGNNIAHMAFKSVSSQNINEKGFILRRMIGIPPMRQLTMASNHAGSNILHCTLNGIKDRNDSKPFFLFSRVLTFINGLGEETVNQLLTTTNDQRKTPLQLLCGIPGGKEWINQQPKLFELLKQSNKKRAANADASEDDSSQASKRRRGSDQSLSSSGVSSSSSSASSLFAVNDDAEVVSNSIGLGAGSR